jgi:hypothetical protein
MWPFSPPDPLKRQISKAMKLFGEDAGDAKFLEQIEQAESILLELPREARPHLITYLQDRNPWARRLAGTALALYLDDEVLEILLREIAKKDPDTCEWFISEIARSNHPRAITSLLPFQGTMNSSMRCTLFESIRNTKPENGSAPLLFCIQDDRSLDSMRERIVGLASYGALDEVAKLWSSFSAEQRNWILLGVHAIDDADLSGRQAVLSAALQDSNEEIALEAFQSIDPDVLSNDTLKPVLEKLQSHPNQCLRSRAKKYLLVIDPPIGGDDDAEKDVFAIGNELQGGVDVAFETAAKWLGENESILFLLFGEAGKRSLSPLQGCNSQEQVLAKVRKWARDPQTKASWFVQMSLGNLEGKSDPNALIAHCAERGQKQGFVVFQLLTRANDGKLSPDGAIDCMGRIDNDFFPD